MVVRYLRPRSVADASEALADGTWRVVAGTTDVYPEVVGRSLTQDIIDLTGVPELRGIDHHDGLWRIGACTTWTDLVQADLPPQFAGLQCAAQQIGGLQIQNRGTVGGNLCTASPAGDGIPALMALSANVELVNPRGARVIPLTDFITGYRTTALAADEFLASIRVPDRPGPSNFAKLGSRSHLVISIVMVATHIETDHADGPVTRIAVGACSPAAMRLRGLEEQLRGSVDFDAVEQYALDELNPIDDIRSSAQYRKTVVRPLVRRSLEACGEQL
ncbi:MAG: FAD binding domain-containing protein [Acidimicrobiales bacterium]